MNIKDKIIRFLKKNYTGSHISLREMSQRMNKSFEALYPKIIELKQKRVINIKEYHEIGRQGPIDVHILNVSLPKMNIWKHPLLTYIVYPLIVIFLAWGIPELVTGVLKPRIQEHQNYLYRRNVASIIYPEVLGNVRKINLCINKFDAGDTHPYKKIKFSTKLFEKHYKEGDFGGNELDLQLANFYNNLNQVDSLFTRADFVRIKAQGDHIIGLLSKEYGCKDYDSFSEIEVGGSEIFAVSADTITYNPEKN